VSISGLIGDGESMNLPLILDIAIGLIFVYLILSLLASEIQELIATLLQWRAKHLRKSIEILLTGGEDTSQEVSIKALVDDLYENPLIRNINQEAKEGIAGLFRKVTWFVGETYRSFTKDKATFGAITVRGEKRVKHSGPSYIDSETFASTLIERLKISQFTQDLTTLNLQIFKEKEIRSRIGGFILDETLPISGDTRSTLQTELQRLDKTLDNILINFKHEKASLATTIDRIEAQLDRYIKKVEGQFLKLNESSSQQEFQLDESSSQQESQLDESSSQQESQLDQSSSQQEFNEFMEELTSLRDDIFYDKNELLRRLQPSVNQIVDVRDTVKKVYEESKEVIGNENSEIYKTYQEVAEGVEGIIAKLPESLQKSLSALSRRAQIKSDKVEHELNQFQQEIETWFDRSMDRASGVYKRNAKGVALLMGLLVAIFANADTFHIINRLSKDSTLRDTITQSASRLSPETNDLESVKQKVNQALEDISLPIGWNLSNLDQQAQESIGWPVKGWPFPVVRRILGWMLSGLAIAMGAPFWFELLGKVINVRNSGPKPVSHSKE
jgi:hypothetical protein